VTSTAARARSGDVGHQSMRKLVIDWCVTSPCDIVSPGVNIYLIHPATNGHAHRPEDTQTGVRTHGQWRVAEPRLYAKLKFAANSLFIIQIHYSVARQHARSISIQKHAVALLLYQVFVAYETI